ncbi:Maf family nucleotide pyrophosphatase [Neisseriaceae bacterium TC5R-5]|nr:Maf family nucleotide pyrophosphatase [Neisseriaceae bacterium TC5R-5]
MAPHPLSIVLASTSPYRQEMLTRLNLPFVTAAPNCDETPLEHESALATAQRLARGKAQSLASEYPQALIIGCDQVALLDGQQIGKPRSLEHAVQMLQWMSGRTVIFHSALALYNSGSGRWQESVASSHVTFRQLSEAQIRYYLEHEPDALHCAGSAKSEGLGGALLAKVEADDPNALIGLPLFQLVDMLSKEGVDILA